MEASLDFLGFFKVMVYGWGILWLVVDIGPPRFLNVSILSNSISLID
jgi:hypothetical protein